MATSWASEAALNALLRYKPQQEGLADLRRAAEERFAQQVTAGKTQGTLAGQAATAAVKPTQQLFDKAATEGQRGRSLTQPILAALGAASPFAAAAANEQAAGGERLATARATALSDLKQRKVSAAELPAFAQQNARQSLVGELQKLMSKEQSLRGSEAGAAKSETDLLRREAQKESRAEREGAANRATSRANTQENNANRKAIAEEKGEIALDVKNRKGKELPLKEQVKAAGVFNTIKGEAKAILDGLTAKGKPVSRGLLLHTLEQPIPSESKEEPDGSKVSTKGHPGYPGNSLTAAALDMAEWGGLSKNTEARLRGDGYLPSRFGPSLQSRGGGGHAGVERPH